MKFKSMAPTSAWHLVWSRVMPEHSKRPDRTHMLALVSSSYKVN